MSVMRNDPETIADELNRQYIELSDEYRRTSDVQTLERALSTITQAVEQTADQKFARSRTRAAHLTNLGRCRGLLYEATGDRTLLDKSIEAGRLAIHAASESSRLRPLCHVNLSDALAKRFFAVGANAGEDFDEALQQARMAVTAADKDGEYSQTARSTLASRLAQYFKYINHDDRCLDEAIVINEELFKTISKKDGLYGVITVNLASDIQDRFQRYGAVDDLRKAKLYFEQAIEALPSGDQNHTMAVLGYASVIYHVADTTGDSKDLESAIQALTTSKRSAHNKQELTKLYHGKSRLYNMKYNHFSKTGDLDQSIKAAEDALRNCEESGLRAFVLQHLSGALEQRAVLRMSMADIDIAFDYARQSADAASGIPAQEAAAQYSMAMRLETKFQLFGGMENLQKALELYRRAFEVLPKDHKDRPMKMHAMANCLLNHFKHYGSVSYLDESIQLYREAAEGLPKGSADRSMALDGLSLSLSMRSKRTGSSQDLEEAITASEAAVDGLSAGRRERPGYLNGLSNRLSARFARFKNKPDLDRAIAAVTEAISACDIGSADEYIYCITLSNCLWIRFAAFKESDDLERSTEMARTALSQIPPSNPDRINALHNLGLRLQAKYQQATNNEDKTKYIEEALDLATQCVEQTPKNHPSLPGLLKELATRQLFRTMLMERAPDEGLIARMLLAASTFEKAFNQTYDTPLARIQNGELGAYLYMQGKDFEKASKILSESIGLFRRASPISLNDQDRQKQLQGLSGISSLACACFIAMGNPEKGLEVLEAGRGIMANIAMGYHADLTEVKDADVDIYKEYVELRNRLSEPLPESRGNSTHGEDLVAQRNADLDQFEAVESKIRSLPGLATFNQNMSAKEMKKLAAFGPLVAFCTVEQRCDAIIVTETTIETISLPGLKNSEIQFRATHIVGKSRLSRHTPSKRGGSNKKMRALLEWIWDKAVQPVLQHLDLLGDQELPPERKTRLWWVTSGAMGLLPLHAAGKGPTKPSQNAYARVISSYIPTFSSLAFARQCQAKIDTASPSMALITMPETPGGLNSLTTEAESRAIREAFAVSQHINAQLDELCQPSAETVFNHIRSSNIDMLHLACHAEPDHENPSNTALLFGSDPTAASPDILPVSRLRHLHTLPQPNRRPPRLAYLSACCTAQQYDLRLIDENIHLASAFQLCGFPAVVGTLWEADDAAAVVIAKAFYEELFRLDAECRDGAVESQPGYHVARALDYATGVYRRRKVGRVSAAMDPLAWASFVYIGA